MQYFHIPQRLYIVPVANETNIPYSRVNHNKYMVTDNMAYIGELWHSKMFNLSLYTMSKFNNVNDNKNENSTASFFTFF